VLVAEPDLEMRRLYRDALRRMGCDVVEAADGREALVEALVRRPSAIVMESRLPLVNGPALCEILRRDSMTRTVPILAVTGDVSSTEAERIRRAGADTVVGKPVEPDALLLELVRLTSSSACDSARTAVVEPEYRAPAPQGPRRRKRDAMSRTHARLTTTTPPLAPPPLRCPTCDGLLVYECSHIGGVSDRHPEQWDDYMCPTCGAFEYRHRTRKLRGREVQSQPRGH
jgi:CheY-like chemotaxis protein